MSVNKINYQSPVVEEIDLFVDAAIASSNYDEFGDSIGESDNEYDW